MPGLWRKLGAAALAVLVGLAWSLPAWAEGEGGNRGLRRFGARIDISGREAGNVLAGGATVTFRGISSGRVVLLGADVKADAEAQDGWLVAGANLDVRGRSHGDTRLYGARIVNGLDVDGDLVAMGAAVEVERSADISGAANLYGQTVEFAGHAAGPLAIEADKVSFTGTADGPVRLEGLGIEIGPGAVINGDLTVYTIGEPVIDPAATIKGKVQRNPLSQSESMRALTQSSLIGRLLPVLLIGGSALIAGLIFLWLGRGGAESTIDELIDSPGSSVLWGLAAVVVVPLTAGLVSLTIFGAPVGLLLLMAMPLLLLVGYAAAGLGVGEWLFNRLGEPRSAGIRALHLLAGLVVLAAFGLLPWVGPLLLVVAMLCGFGALLRTLRDRLRGPVRV